MSPDERIAACEAAQVYGGGGCYGDCHCPLDGESACWDSDVLQLVAYSIEQTRRERDMTRSEAILALRAEGVADWGCPARQQHRRGEWEDAIRVELEGLRVDAREVR